MAKSEDDAASGEDNLISATQRNEVLGFALASHRDELNPIINRKPTLQNMMTDAIKEEGAQGAVELVERLATSPLVGQGSLTPLLAHSKLNTDPFLFTPVAQPRVYDLAASAGVLDERLEAGTLSLSEVRSLSDSLLARILSRHISKNQAVLSPKLLSKKELSHTSKLAEKVAELSLGPFGISFESRPSLILLTALVPKVVRRAASTPPGSILAPILARAAHSGPSGEPRFNEETGSRFARELVALWEHLSWHCPRPDGVLTIHRRLMRLRSQELLSGELLQSVDEVEDDLILYASGESLPKWNTDDATTRGLSGRGGTPSGTAAAIWIAAEYSQEPHNSLAPVAEGEFDLYTKAVFRRAIELREDRADFFLTAQGHWLSELSCLKRVVQQINVSAGPARDRYRQGYALSSKQYLHRLRVILLEALAHPCPLVTRRAFTALASSGEAATKSIETIVINILTMERDERPDIVRERCLRLLGYLGAGASVAPVHYALLAAVADEKASPVTEIAAASELINRVETSLGDDLRAAVSFASRTNGELEVLLAEAHFRGVDPTEPVFSQNIPGHGSVALEEMRVWAKDMTHHPLRLRKG